MKEIVHVKAAILEIIVKMTPVTRTLAKMAADVPWLQALLLTLGIGKNEGIEIIIITPTLASDLCE